MNDDFFPGSTLINTFFSSVSVLMVINHNKLLFQSRCFSADDELLHEVVRDVVNYHLSSVDSQDATRNEVSSAPIVHLCRTESSFSVPDARMMENLGKIASLDSSILIIVFGFHAQSSLPIRHNRRI